MTANSSRHRSRRSRPSYSGCSRTPHPRADAPAGSAVREQPAQGVAGALDVRHRRGRRTDQQPRRTRPPRPGHSPQALPRHQQQSRRTLRRTRSIRRDHLPPAEPLALRLPPRTTRRSQPRRPFPRAHLSQGPRTERLRVLPIVAGSRMACNGVGRVCTWFALCGMSGPPRSPSSIKWMYVLSVNSGE